MKKVRGKTEPKNYKASTCHNNGPPPTVKKENLSFWRQKYKEATPSFFFVGISDDNQTQEGGDQQNSPEEQSKVVGLLFTNYNTKYNVTRTGGKLKTIKKKQ